MIDYPKYYLYRHIRLDKNVPFYIGIAGGGKPCTFKQFHGRAFVKRNRNSIWKQIVKKTPYRVEIIFRSDSEEIILNKEKEFIKLYGRIDKKTGTLANLTDGGEGRSNWIPSQAFLDACKRRPQLTGINHPASTKVYVYSNITGEFIQEFISYREAEKFFGLCLGTISSAIRRKKPTHAMLCFNVYQGETVNIVKPSKCGYKIEQYSLNGRLLNTFNNIKEAADKMGVSVARIRHGLVGNGRLGFYLRYESIEPFKLEVKLKK